MQHFSAVSPQRLDTFLVSAIGCTRTHAQRLVRAECVAVNGQTVRKPSHVLCADDAITVEPFDDDRHDRIALEPIDLQLPILYEDDACIVINKPAGIAVHPAPTTKGEPTVLHGIAFLYVERALPFAAHAALVHRLDKETTGCLLVAKTPDAHHELQQQFQSRTVRKTYLALVAGAPDPASAVIDAPVGRKLTDRTKMSVFRTSVSREARTVYRTRQACNGCALLECDLHTGRTHQIRVHLSSIGHPIIGDIAYGSPQSCALAESLAIVSLCLHAWHLTFVSPANGAEHTTEAPVPPAFVAALQRIGCSIPSAKTE